MTKEQQRAYNQARYAANREAIKARVRAYAAEHKEEIRAANKVYREANKERLSASAKARYAANPQAKIAYQKALHASKPEAVKAYKKQWWDTNREQFSAKRKRPENRAHVRVVFKKWYDKSYHAGQREKFIERAARRKALKASSQVETVDLKKILHDARGLCGICKKPFDLFGIEFDHIIPLAKGGPHIASNIQATHSYCNRSKGAKLA